MAPAEGDMSSLETLHRVDELCLRFEDEWRAGRRPDVEAYLADVAPEQREVLLPELLLLEWDYRRHAGESFSLAEYARRHAGVRGAVERARAQWTEQARRAGDTDPPGEKTPMAASAATPSDRSTLFAPPAYEC